MHVHKTLLSFVVEKLSKRKKQNDISAGGVEPTTSTMTNNYHGTAPFVTRRSGLALDKSTHSSTVMAAAEPAYFQSCEFRAQPKKCCSGPKLKNWTLKFWLQVLMT